MHVMVTDRLLDNSLVAYAMVSPTREPVDTANGTTTAGALRCQDIKPLHVVPANWTS